MVKDPDDTSFNRRFSEVEVICAFPLNGLDSDMTISYVNPEAEMMIKMTMMRKILENLSQTGEKDGVCHSGEAGLHHHERAGELGDGDHSYGDSDGDGGGDDGGGRVIMTYLETNGPNWTDCC